LHRNCGFSIFVNFSISRFCDFEFFPFFSRPPPALVGSCRFFIFPIVDFALGIGSRGAIPCLTEGINLDLCLQAFRVCRIAKGRLSASSILLASEFPGAETMTTTAERSNETPSFEARFWELVRAAPASGLPSSLIALAAHVLCPSAEPIPNAETRPAITMMRSMAFSLLGNTFRQHLQRRLSRSQIRQQTLANGASPYLKALCRFVTSHRTYNADASGEPKKRGAERARTRRGP
jgi:hypothetical protein